jgi:hypothetical protein
MLASPSAAGTLTIDVALDGGQVELIGFSVFGTTFLKPASFSGSARIVLTGVDSLGALTAPSATGSLQALRLQLDFPPSNPGPAFTSAHFSQIGVAAGGFDGAMLRLAATDLAFEVELPPLSGSGFLPGSSDASLALLGLAMPGAAQLALRGSAGSAAGGNMLPFILNFDVRGREVARSFSAPEAPELGLLCLGLVLLGAQVARRSRSAC